MFTFHHYVFHWTTSPGKPGKKSRKKPVRAPRASDEEAKLWARQLIEYHRGGSGFVALQDGTIFHVPEPAPEQPPRTGAV